MKKISSYILCSLLLLGGIGCKNSDELHYDAAFIQDYQEHMALYALDSIELAEEAMLRLESRLIEIEGNPELYGVKRKHDYLYSTRLRLWGIYKTKEHKQRMNEYKKLLQSMSKSEAHALTDAELIDAVMTVDEPFPPKWTGRTNEAWDKFKIMSLEEMIEQGYIKRVE